MKLFTTTRILLFCLIIANCSLAFAQDTPLAPKKVYEAMQAKMSETEAENLATKLRGWFGKDNQGRDNLVEGRMVKTDDLYIVWAVEAASAPNIKSHDGAVTFPMKKRGATNVYAAAQMLPSGAALKWQQEKFAEGKFAEEKFAVRSEDSSQDSCCELRTIGCELRTANYKLRTFFNRPFSKRPISPANSIKLSICHCFR